MEKRMYFFVPYNISPIQQSIQAGHAALEYARKYGDTELFMDFVDNHKTWIILNGGTTNEHPDRLGTLNKIYIDLLNYDANIKNGQIKIASFKEPDLNDALTAICFICDEHVWDYEKYPDWKDYLLEHSFHPLDDRKKSYDELKQKYPTLFYKWTEEIMNGEKNVFLRELLKGKKLA